MISFDSRQRRHGYVPLGPRIRGGSDHDDPEGPIALISLRGENGVARHRGVRGYQGDIASAFNTDTT